MKQIIQDTIKYGSQNIDIAVIFVERDTLEISVYPDKSVFVRAPANRSYEDVRNRIMGKARWIRRQQEYFRNIIDPSPPRRYVGGETHRYLGRQYRLYIQSPGNETHEFVKLDGPYFRVYTQSDAPEHVKTLLYQWYRRRATAKFRERMNGCYPIVRKYGIEEPPLSIRLMKKRWGSFTPSGRILLNLELIKAPTYCIDYVLLHELCHAKHAHHGPAFYDLLSRVMPEWEKAKQRLEMVQPDCQ